MPRSYPLKKIKTDLAQTKGVVVSRGEVSGPATLIPPNLSPRSPWQWKTDMNVDNISVFCS